MCATTAAVLTRSFTRTAGILRWNSTSLRRSKSEVRIQRPLPGAHLKAPVGAVDLITVSMHEGCDRKTRRGLGLHSKPRQENDSPRVERHTGGVGPADRLLGREERRATYGQPTPG